MIDYLEAALAEEPEEELPARGRRRAVLSARQRSGQGPEPAGTGPVPRGGEAPDEPAAPAGERGAEWEETAASPPVLTDGEPELPAWEGWLPQGERETGAAGTLLRALARTGRSLRVLRQGPGVMTVTLPREGGETTEVRDLEALDLAMQRDARRYDGGFQLY